VPAGSFSLPLGLWLSLPLGLWLPLPSWLTSWWLTGTDNAAMTVRSRSAMARAWSSRVCGSRTANSSPPNRPARS
jgi:hypothetical protein